MLNSQDWNGEGTSFFYFFLFAISVRDYAIRSRPTAIARLSRLAASRCTS